MKPLVLYTEPHHEYFSEEYFLKIAEESKDSLSDVEPKWEPPEGLFTKSARTIVRTLRKSSKNDGQAMKRLVFYTNRAGKDCPNKKELVKAKEMLKSE